MTKSKNIYNISLVISVDPDASFLEVDNGGNQDVILELIEGQLYDLDDIKVEELEVEYVRQKGDRI